MPRNGRICIVGKCEAREIEAQTDELKELGRALRREWRRRGDDRAIYPTSTESDNAPWPVRPTKNSLSTSGHFWGSA
jgi:hypothetical protein